MVARGEIWWYEPPDEKARPYLVMTRDSALPVLTRILGVPATGTVRGIPTEVHLGRDDGMPTDCVLSVDNTSLIYKSLLTRRLTILRDERLRQVCEALGLAVAC